MKKIFNLSLLLMAVPAALFSQKYFPKTELIADMDTLYKNIRETHVDMFTVISRPEFEKRLDEAKASIPDSMTRLDFFKVIAPVVTAIGDGHTDITVPFRDINNRNPYWLPVSLKVGETLESLVVSNDNYEGLPKGTEILIINGRPAAEIIKTLLSYVSGESVKYRVNSIENPFEPWFSLLENTDTFTIEYKSGGDVRKIDLKAIRFNDALAKYEKKSGDSKPPFAYTVIDSLNTALFRYNHFDINNKEFPSFFDSMLMDIKNRNIENLIIDLRSNGGGDSRMGNAILRCISKVPFAQIGGGRYRVSEQSKKADKSMRGMENGVYEEKESPNKLIQPNKNTNQIIKRDIYLLTSLNTFSSASKFAWAFQHFDMGTVVGEETGGYVIAFGNAINFKLPNTQLSYRSSYKEFFNYGATEADRHGVIPDYEVTSEQALDKALELIAHKRQE